MKLLKLPLLVQAKILRRMKLSWVIILSTMNKRMKRVLNACGFPIDQWLWHGSEFLSLEKEGNGIVCFNFMRGNPVSNNSSLLLENGSVIAKFRNTDGDSETTFNVNFVTEPRSSLELKMKLIEIVSQFFSTFIIPISFDLRINNYQMNLNELFFWDITQKFQNLWILDDDFRLQISEETLKFLLGKVAADTMQLKVQCPATNFKLERPNQEVKQNNIVVWKPNFLDFESFIDTLNSPHITVYRVSMMSINQILKGWIQGRNNVMEFMLLTIDLTGNDNEEEKGSVEQVLGDELEIAHLLPARNVTGRIGRVIFKGIKITKPTVTEEQWRARFQNVPTNSDIEIRRVSDNRPATINIDATSVDVYVWSDVHLHGAQAIQN